MNKVRVEGNGVIVIGNERFAYIDGKKVPFHPNMRGNNVTTVDNKVYIDGFEYKNGKWKRTLKGFFHKWF